VLGIQIKKWFILETRMAAINENYTLIRRKSHPSIQSRLRRCSVKKI